MRIAVIGGSGQLGSDLVQTLAQSGGYDVTSLARPRLDVTDRAAVMKAIGEGGFEAVVNCAAFTHVEGCEESADEALRVNALAAFHVAGACAAAGSSCVHVSTDYVFSGDKGSPYAEQDAPGPINVYGTSKLAGEFLVRQAAAHWLIVRVSSLFGKRGARAKGGNFVETILAKARSGGSADVVDDIWMSPTYTMDAARLIERLIHARATGIVHAANAGACTWHEFASEAVRRVGLPARIVGVGAAAYPTKARRPKNSSLTSVRLEKIIGRCARPWQDALGAYLAEKGYV